MKKEQKSELIVKNNSVYRVTTTVEETKIKDIAETISVLKTRQGELLTESDEITKQIEELNNVL